MSKWKHEVYWAAACVLALSVFAAYAQAQGSQMNLPDGAKMRLGKGSIQQIAYSPDSRSLAAGGSLGIWIYDAGTGAETALLQAHTAPVMSVAYSPDGKTLASGSLDTTVCVWDAQTGALLKTLTGHSIRIFFGCLLAGRQNARQRMRQRKGTRLERRNGRTDTDA